MTAAAEKCSRAINFAPLLPLSFAAKFEEAWPLAECAAALDDGRTGNLQPSREVLVRKEPKIFGSAVIQFAGGPEHKGHLLIPVIICLDGGTYRRG